MKVFINRFHTITFSENCSAQLIIDSYLTFHHFIFCVLGFPVHFYRHFSEQRGTVLMKVSVFWRWKILWCITVIYYIVSRKNRISFWLYIEIQLFSYFITIFIISTPFFWNVYDALIHQKTNRLLTRILFLSKISVLFFPLWVINYQVTTLLTMPSHIAFLKCVINDLD